MFFVWGIALNIAPMTRRTPCDSRARRIGRRAEMPPIAEMAAVCVV